MPLQSLLRYLLNNPHIVNELSETRIIRRLAQIAAYAINKSQQKGFEAIEKMSESDTLRRMADQEPSTEDRLSSFRRNFAKELKNEMDRATRDFKAGKKS